MNTQKVGFVAFFVFALAATIFAKLPFAAERPDIDYTALKLVFDHGGGKFDLYVGPTKWFTSGPVRVFYNNTWHSSEDESLKIDSGSDALGSYKFTGFRWSSGADGVVLETYARVYLDNSHLLVFGQAFPQNLNNTSLENFNLPLAEFPSLTSNPHDVTLGYVHLAGPMSGQGNIQFGIWPTSYTGGIWSGPLAFFDPDLNTVLFSSLTEFTSGLHTNGSTAEFVAGVQGMARSVPAGFAYETVMVSSSDGVYTAFMEWGDAMLTYYRGNTMRAPPDVSSVISLLGYSTTGFYFYSPLNGNRTYGNYEQTLYAVRDYALSVGIPYNYYLIDSWWYAEYFYGGVWMWEDSPELLSYRFPSGLGEVHRTLEAPFAAHMGMWLSSSPYVTNPNTSDGWYVSGNFAFPTGAAFWDWLFAAAANDWGLVSLKQDHIDQQIPWMANVTLADVFLFRDWLEVQQQAAHRHNVHIEYCMDWPAVVMASLWAPLGVVTHARASNDYLPGDVKGNLPIGEASLFLWALGLYPDKDTFYTSSSEKNVFATSPFCNYTEPWPFTHAVVMAMSAGPFTPSDAIGGSDPALITAACTADGSLLKPDQPAVPIDAYWLMASGNGIGPLGELYTTGTVLAGATWHYAIGWQLNSSYEFSVDDLLPVWNAEDYRSANVDSYVAYHLNASLNVEVVVRFSKDEPLFFDSGDNYGALTYWVICPPFSENGLTLLGEVGKLVPVSRQRIVGLDVWDSGVSIGLVGAPGETVQMAIAESIDSMESLSDALHGGWDTADIIGEFVVKTYSCILSDAGTATLVVPEGTCKP